MLCKNFLIGTNNYTAYAHKSGLSIAYTPIAGLPEKYTLNGALHDDVLTDKATYTIRMNPVTEAIAQAILSAYRTQTQMTIFDVITGTNVTINYKRAPTPVNIAMVKDGAAYRWQLGNLVFQEK